MSLNLRYARQVKQQRRSGARRQWMKQHGLLWLNARIRAVAGYRGYYRAAQDMQQEDHLWFEAQLAACTAELDTARARISELDDEVSDLTTECVQLHFECDEWRKQWANLNRMYGIRTRERDAAKSECEVLRRALEAVEERLHDFTEGYECACDVSIGLVNCEFCQMTALLDKVQKARADADAGGRDEA